jgi:AcrR family transcriptional regulator
MKKTAEAARRGAGRLGAQDAAKLNDRLLDAAQSLFSDKGFALTTMDEVARKAGSSTQTIYSRFPSKAELLEAVARRIIETTVARHIEATPNPKGVDPRAYLIGLGSRVVSTLSGEAAGLTRLSIGEGHRSAELRRLTALGFGRGAGLIEAALKQWRDAGVLKPKGDLARASRICLSMITDRPRIQAALGEPMPAKEARAHVEQAVDIFLTGCVEQASA